MRTAIADQPPTSTADVARVPERNAVDLADFAALRQRSLIFSTLSDAELDTVMRLARTRHHGARQVVFREGEPGDHLLVLLRGRVKVSLISAEGKEVILSLLEPGDVFGEMALLDGEVRSASVTTMEDCAFLTLGRGDFLAFLERTPGVALKLLAALSRRLRATNELVGSLSFLGLAARLARVLLNLMQQYGRIGEHGIVISLRLSQEELGNLAGVSRESINRQLRAWVEAGYIDISHGNIVVRQADALFREALSN